MSIFCKYPFEHIYSDSFGMMMPCCNAVTNHPNKPDVGSNFPCKPIEDGLFSYRNIPEMKQLREDMRKENPYTDLVKDVCRKCILAEEQGLPSMRSPVQDVSEDGRIYELKVRLFGNACNLQCYMCHIKNSSSRISQTEKMIQSDQKVSDFLEYDLVPDYLKTGGGIKNPESFDRHVEDIKKHANKIKSVNIIGGEPFVMSTHYKLLDALIECGESKNIELKYDSNLTKLKWDGCKVTDYFKKFKTVDIRWSIEGYGKYDEYIRYPTNWEDTVKNYNFLSIYSNVKVSASITLSGLAVLHLDELVSWLDSRGILYHFNNLETPEVCKIDHLHPTIRKELSRKYAGTSLEFLCKELDKDVVDWEIKWDNTIRYLRACDYVNGTDYEEIFPELNV